MPGSGVRGTPTSADGGLSGSSRFLWRPHSRVGTPQWRGQGRGPGQPQLKVKVRGSPDCQSAGAPAGGATPPAPRPRPLTGET